jgi:RNA polymerase sigma-70 factor (ECF subfamily)
MVRSAFHDPQSAASGADDPRRNFASLVVRYRAPAFRLAWRLTGNRSDAEETIQEAFLRALRALDAFQGRASFGTWLYRIVANEALMRRRAAKRHPTVSFEESSGPGGECADRDARDLGEALDRKRSSEKALAALAALDHDHRAAFVLQDIEDLSSPEAAVILGVSPEAARQRARRARLRLRAHLREEMDADAA